MGNATQGTSLSINSSTLVDANGLGTFSYQWLRNGQTISGATALTYTLTAADLSSPIAVRVSYTDGMGYAEQVTSAATTSVTKPANTLPTGTVSIVGNATQGTSLSINSSTLVDANGLGTFSYQWLRNGQTISGANASTYTLTAADLSSPIAVRVSYTDNLGYAEQVTSGATANITKPANTLPTGAVSIVGSTLQGASLSINSSNLVDVDGVGTFSYQWLRNGQTISGATTSTYTLTAADVNAPITVRLSYIDNMGYAEQVTSAATAHITKPANTLPTGTVSIVGNAIQGSALSLNTNTLVDVDGLGTFSYQWLRNGQTISGATTPTYTLTAADVNTPISVRVSYTDNMGYAEQVTSSATAHITKPTGINQTLIGTHIGDVLTGGDGNDTIYGLGGNDSLMGAGGNDIISGGTNIDTVIYSNHKSEYLIKNESSTISIFSNWIIQHGNEGTGLDGIDTLNGIERVQFSNINLALDLDGNAGKAAKLLGAVLGKNSVSDPSFVGVVLGLLDSGIAYPELMQIALNFTLGSSISNATVADLFIRNLLGFSTVELQNTIVQLLDTGAYTQSALGVAVADLSFNTDNINLVGLQQTGVLYLIA